MRFFGAREEKWLTGAGDIVLLPPISEHFKMNGTRTLCENTEEDDLELHFLKRTLRVAAALIAIVMLLGVFSGCSARKLPTTAEDLQVVGTVGEYEVLYEELRFLVLLYKSDLEDKYGKGIWDSAETAALYCDELESLVYEDLTANYALLTLAAEEGMSIDDYAEEVQDYMDTIMEEDFLGSRSNYKAFLKEMSLTDHYVRFTAGVDAVYDALYYRYLIDGTIDDNETTVKQYILQNFVRVASICLINVTENEYEAHLEEIRQYRDEVVAGADISDYVKYSLDLSPEHCFARGEMEEAFEEAAFSLLEVGDVSEVFESEADYLGYSCSAWYFLQKLQLDLQYIEENYETLFDQYAVALISEKVETVRDGLAFVPNEYGKSLDLLSIEPIEEVKDNTHIIVLICVAIVLLLVVGAVVLFRVLNRTSAPKPRAKDGKTAKK